jgi:phage tail sheath protein FI
MPEYLAPGVFVEETSFRSKSIEGVGTSVASIVGPTRTGPLRGVPEVVTSYGEFERIYGDADDLVLDDGAGNDLTVPNYTAHAARAFFDNGGKQLFVARVVRGVNDANAVGAGTTADVAESDAAVTDVSFAARFPGAAGNLAIELFWQDSENLLTTTNLSVAEDGELFYLEADNVAAAAKIVPGPANASFPLDIRAVVRRNAGAYEVVGTALLLQPGTQTVVVPGTPLSALTIAQLAPADTRLVRVAARRPAGSVLADGTPAVLTLRQAVDLSSHGFNLGALTGLSGYLDATGTTLTLPIADNPGLPGGADVDLPLAALANDLADVVSVVVRLFDLDVHKGDKDGEAIWNLTRLTAAPGTARSLDAMLPADPAKKADALAQPISCALDANATGADVMAALASLYNPTDLNPPEDSLDDPRHIILLDGGDDGQVPNATDYAGEEDETKGPTGFKALEAVEDISICMVPAAAAHAATHKAVVMEMQKHCRRMRYRVGIVDSREGMSLGEVREFRNNFDDSRMALYYPWVVMADPTGQTLEIAVPPAGFIAGVYANTDVTRGVHKAPANEVVVGALRFNQDINKFQQELLNPNGINCLRSFPGRGHRVWGGRTLSSDPEWKYVNVRRYFNYLERSIEKSTQWAVFEPNGEALWANIRSAVEDFLFNEWTNGRLLGATPKAAYFVRCDRSTMTQNDIDNGRMVCVVGVAALKPAEFVIFRIGQKTADA